MHEGGLCLNCLKTSNHVQNIITARLDAVHKHSREFENMMRRFDATIKTVENDLDAYSGARKERRNLNKDIRAELQKACSDLDDKNTEAKDAYGEAYDSF